MLGIGTPGVWELLIVLAIVLLIFGPSKLKGLGKGLGTTLREFRDGMSGKESETPPTPPADTATQPSGDGDKAALSGQSTAPPDD